MTSIDKIAEQRHDGDDIYRDFIGSIPYMMKQARAAVRQSAHSYRGFLVGASAYAVRTHSNETAVLSAGNLKNQHKTKVCAERKALSLAKKAGFEHVVGLVVAATTNLDLIEGVTGRKTPTLHPCGDCRDMFHDHPLARPDMLVVTTGLDTNKYQVHTAAGLAEFYAQPAPALEAQDVVAGIDNWDMRLATYDVLASAELTRPSAERRPAPMLAQMALTRSL